MLKAETGVALSDPSCYAFHAARAETCHGSSSGCVAESVVVMWRFVNAGHLGALSV